MNYSGGIKEFNAALVGNFKLKAKILCSMFGLVFTFQLIALTYFSIRTDFIGHLIPTKIVIIGPSIMLFAIISEFMMIQYLGKMRGQEEQLKKGLIYLVTFTEVSFPAILLIVIGSILISSAVYTPLQMLNTPFYALFFIMIILSSLLLESRLCLFAGIAGGLEFFLINFYFISGHPTTMGTDYINAFAKSVLIVVSGLMAGFVSKKIREAIISSLESKNELIHTLDMRVAEKTKEVIAQKTEIENKNILLLEKQKEIIDSIHYAKRIQRSLLTSEKYISRHIKK